MSHAAARRFPAVTDQTSHDAVDISVPNHITGREPRMTLPNFVFIGAPRSGTTALWWYLSEHPEIYAGPRHHIGYLAYVADESGESSYGDPEMHKWHVRTLEEYEALFENAGDATAIGDVSPIYLEVPHAASRMHELIPDARVLCSLRHPVDRAYSDYLKYLRKRGRRIDPDIDLRPDAAWVQPDSHWMILGRYHEQLSRYYDLFPRGQIHVFLAEDLKHNTPRAMREIFAFLGVDEDFTPDTSTPHNVGGVPSSSFLEHLLTNQRLRLLLKPLVPRSLADRLRRMRTANMQKVPPLPTDLRRKMIEALAVEVEKTSELTGINLSHWLE